MGFLSQYSATERVDLGDNFYVVVRVFLPSDGEFEAQRRMAKLTATPDDSGNLNINTAFDQGAYLKEVASQCLVEWNLTDEDDKPLPFGTIEEKRASVGRLPKYVIDKMVAEVKDKPDKDADFRAADPVSNPEG